MYLQKLSLFNFKNFAEREFTFSSKMNCLLGNNGTGKTNVLDAIHYLCFCKSFINPVDSQNIMHDESFFVIQGEFIKKDKTENVYCSMKRNLKKQFKRNKKEYQRLADHIGLFPLVVISPMDSTLITEGSEVRRKFIDSVIAQYDKTYLEQLINYNKVLAQRNALLKHFAQRNSFDLFSLLIWDRQMIDLGMQIHASRNKFIEDFIPIFQKYFDIIANSNEVVSIEYESQLAQGNYEETLNNALKKDRIVQYSTVGIHKDDLVFKIRDYPLRKIASQGQQKSFLIALKLAELEYIKNIKKITPILLLDDIFDKLDHSRVTRLMDLVNEDGFGQIFITDTNTEQLPAMLPEITSYCFN